ncbi:MAG: FHA domain-containing protein [Nitriliruptoraceae bacterium]
MPIELLTLLKFALLALLYLFVARTVRSVSAELYGRGRKRRRSATPRPAVAAPSEPSRRSRRIPRELVVHNAGRSPAVVPLSGHGLVLGRGANVDLLLDDVYVSDEHAQVMPDDGSWSVRDLGSTNGTFLNGAKVTRPTPLAVGDQLRIGKTHIEVRR